MTTESSGIYKGRHYTTYVEEVKALKRAQDYQGAAKLLLALVDTVEQEARANQWAVAPWYYDQLAIIFRKTKEPEKELEILDRYASWWRAENGPLPSATAIAIDKARKRLGKAPASGAPPKPAVFERRTTCVSCSFEHEALTRCPRCGAPR
jgi:hypothetical protein